MPESSEDKNSRQKWEKGVNRIVIECWLRSEPNKRRYTQRLKRLWDELGVFEATEQRIACQARAIRLNEWLTSLEIEEIKQKIENNPHNEEGVIDEIDEERQEEEISESNDKQTVSK